MKRFLIPLLAALTLPTAVNAFTVSQKYVSAHFLATSWCRINNGFATEEEGIRDLIKSLGKRRISIEIMRERDVKLVARTIHSTLDKKCLMDESKIPSGRSFESRLKELLSN